jgi:hypothetical protein
VGEATPSYLSSPSAAQRIGGVIPDARLVCMLREPVERAYSHYWLDRELGIQALSFEDAVEAEPALPAAAAPGEDPRRLYLGVGRYLEHLQRFTRHFPREAMLVLLFERLRDDPRGTFATLCRFLGVDEGFVPRDLDLRANAYRGYWSRSLRRRLRGARPTLVTRALARINQTRRRTYPPMDPGLRARLRESFVEPNRALAAWLGRELPEEWSV